MKTNTLTLLLCVLVSFQTAFSQTNYQRIEIANPSNEVYQVLANVGADLDCGSHMHGDNLIVELADYEVEALRTQGISFEVLIDDMTTFYSQRAIDDLPRASAEIKRLKRTQNPTVMHRTVSATDVIANIGQYTGEEEIEWAVPQNWNINDVENYPSRTEFFGGCLTYQQVLDELDDMRTLYPDIISARTNADPSATPKLTIEGRTVWMVRISDNPDVNEANEPETLYQSLIHSREAASIMSQLYFMWYLLENYDTDPAIKYLINNHELYFIPVFNPDGFVYNETVAPNGGGGQRKNRNVGADNCVNTSGTFGNIYRDGIDLNRNSAYYWGNGGASNDICNDTYRGSAPFSENETQIMRDFFLDNHEFKIALNHHSFKNSMLHAYAGVNQANPRPDEYSKYNHDMTYYNRYGYGPSTSITSLNSGNMNDWMLGGPAGTSASGTPTGTGSGQHTMAWTPENGAGINTETSGGSFGGFWPQPSAFLPISQRAMRMNLLAAYYSGKYAKLHDLTQNDINSLNGNLTFGIERLGQTAGDFTLTVTPISSNITSIGGAVTESFINAANPNYPTTETNPIQVELEQREVDIAYTLDPFIQNNDLIEYRVVLTSDYATDNILYEAIIKKRYNPTVNFSENANPTNLNNWNAIGSQIAWTTTTDAFPPNATGTAITTGTSPYANNTNNALVLNGTVDLSNNETTLIQFHAKWDLERSFDYMQLQASTDGTNWFPLTGKLTKPGHLQVNNQYSQKGDEDIQPAGQPLYDGDTQDRWNMEEIVIDDVTNNFLYNSPTASFRFRFFTDGSNRQDSYINANFEGFTFDNFKIINFPVPCDDTNSPTGLTLETVTPTSAVVSWDRVKSATYDVRYRQVGAGSWNTITDITTTSTAINGLAENEDYEVQVATRCVSSTSSFSSSLNLTTETNANCLDFTISNYPYSESFENPDLNDFGLWTQAANFSVDDINWTKNTGRTPSGGNSSASNQTGPNTGSEGTGSYYLFTEASTNVSPAGSPNRRAYLDSPCIDLTSVTEPELTFDYHMFGSQIGSLAIEVSFDNGTSYSPILERFIATNNQEGENPITGQQQTSITAAWRTQVVDLSLYVGQVIKLRINGTTGSGYRSDIAIDNINITATQGTLNNEDIVIDASNLNIYPNPFNEGFTISLPRAIANEDIDISIFDINGRKVFFNTFSNASNSILVNNLDNLTSSVYIVRIESKRTKTLFTRRLVKN